MARKMDSPKPADEPAPQTSAPVAKGEAKEKEKANVSAPRPRGIHWAWPLGVALAGAGSAAAYLLRGCWHTHMSWPTSVDDEFSYQVCTSCGIKRLFDSGSFHGYGPYGYDLHDLIARERAARLRRRRRHEEMLARKQAQATSQQEPPQAGESPNRQTGNS